MSHTVSHTDLYDIPQELLEVRELVRRLAREQIAPRAADSDRSAEYPWDVRRLLAKHDVLALPFEPEYGGTGTGTGTVMLQMVVEEIAKVCVSSALILMVQELGSLPVSLFGSPKLKAEWLQRFATGELAPPFALSEPEAGSDPAAMRTTAVRDGDEWVLSGAKNWISNAGIADVYVVFAKTDRDAGRSSAFLVEADRVRFSIGNVEHKLGIKGSPTGSPVLEDVRVPNGNLIGAEGNGLSVALGTLDRTRLGAAAQAVGIAQAQPTTRTRTPRSASRSASRSTSSRASSSSSRTWRRAPRPRANSYTRPARWSTAPSRRSASTPRWRSCLRPTTRCESRSRRSRCWAATAT
jgi:alkylation response protein AidB-like acyl-CoA dehydrogenase